MGQYFAAVNTDKKEFVCPWCIDGGAKLWEWAANTQGAIFVLLLRQSSGGGGGDFYDPLSDAREIDITGKSPADSARAVSDAIALGVAAEGFPIKASIDTVVGRWAGDRVALVGDYDESGLWKELYEQPAYRNISGELVEAWNRFIDLEDMKLRYTCCSSCKISSHESARAG